MIRLNLMFFLALSLGLSSLRAQSLVEENYLRFAFYNVENLFDTTDDPDKIDEEFLPDGKKAWDDTRYTTKLNQIGEVMEAMDFPDVMGLCEVENGTVLFDLISQERLEEKSYDFVHYESPDARGIDVALLYASSVRLLGSNFIRVDFPEWLEAEGYTSRDILHAELVDGEDSVFHVFVNHWPSRRGGESASQHRRLWVASHLRRAVDEVLSRDPLARVFIMGDFNDEPSNNSVTSALGTLGVDSTLQVPGLLYNPFLSLQAAGEGSYNYRGDWNMLDQIIVAGMTAPNNWRVTAYGVFKEDFLLYEGKSPNKTYGGSKYYGGYSDHLPVYLKVGRE